MLDKSNQLLDRPCWVVFDLGRALNWRLFAIPDPFKPEKGESQFVDLVALLEARIWNIDGPSALYRALLEDVPPFEWAGTSSLLRAAQIVAIGKFLGIPDQPTRNSLLQHKFQIATQIHGDAPVEKVVDEFIAGI
jgi:hypothetical protein